MSQTVQKRPGFNIGGVRLSKAAVEGLWFEHRVRGAGVLHVKLRHWDKTVDRQLAEMTKQFQRDNAEALGDLQPTQHPELAEVYNASVNAFVAETVIKDAAIEDGEYTVEIGVELLEDPSINTFITRKSRDRYQFTELAVKEKNLKSTSSTSPILAKTGS